MTEKQAKINKNIYNNIYFKKQETFKQKYSFGYKYGYFKLTYQSVK